MSEEKESPLTEDTSDAFVRMKERADDLESRLKEAGNETIIWIERLQDADKLIQSLEQRLSQAEAENKRLASRDGNAKIQLCYNDGVNPFAKEDLKVVDFGVSDNIYIVESKRLSHLMDVAGKMAGAIEAYQNCERASCFDCHKRMREARAEWDGIKKEGVK